MKTLMDEINQFRDERQWRQYHTHKDLALSVSIEAAELLENFQWKSDEVALELNSENIKDEIADVYIYLMMLTDNLGLDIEEIVKNKLLKNAIKYPINKEIKLDQKPAK